MKYIIEHLDGTVYKWCLLEYKHASQIVGKENIIFTNVTGEAGREKLAPHGEVKEESVTRMDLQNVCILDPLAEKTLSPDDKFDYVIFGGILGDYPPKRRTKDKLSNHIKCEKRNLGSIQMSTNTAVLVAYKILEEKKKFEDLEFADEIIIPTGEGEEVELPFRYLVDGDGVILAPGFIDFLKTRKGF